MRPSDNGELDLLEALALEARPFLESLLSVRELLVLIFGDSLSVTDNANNTLR